MNELEFNFGNPAAEPSAEGRFGAERMPLAARMRPRTLEEYCGQSHILAPGKLLRRAIDADNFSSIILSGPPGVGKTSLAELIANTTDAAFVRLSGVTSTVADIRREIVMAKERRSNARRRTILFVDEIHRFNRAQQDSLLPDVESGVVRLIGATTFNPTFYVVNALMSRSLNFQLEPLAREDIKKLLTNALTDERGFGKLKVELAPEAMEFFAEVCEGDGRRSLNALEMAVLSTPVAEDGVIHVDLAVAEESVQKKVLNYDDDAHYDTASAFIKSMRGSDPDAAVYYLAKMLHAGEDIRFIARRMVILASEDIGNADPRAITLATSAMQAVDLIGMPEARLSITQAIIFICESPKSNSVVMAVDAAFSDAKKFPDEPVPIHLRDTSFKGADKLGHGVGYKYPHDYPGHVVVQEYMPEADPDYSYDYTEACQRIPFRTIRCENLTIFD